MSNPRKRRMIAGVGAAGLALLGWSCAGRIEGFNLWTMWGHGTITNAEWGRRVCELPSFRKAGTNAATGQQTTTNATPME